MFGMNPTCTNIARMAYSEGVFQRQISQESYIIAMVLLTHATSLHSKQSQKSFKRVSGGQLCSGMLTPT